MPIDASAPDGQSQPAGQQPTGQGGIVFKGQTRVTTETDPLLKEAAEAIAKGANPADVQLELQRRGYTIQAAPPAQPAGAP